MESNPENVLQARVWIPCSFNCFVKGLIFSAYYLTKAGVISRLCRVSSGARGGGGRGGMSWRGTAGQDLDIGSQLVQDGVQSPPLRRLSIGTWQKFQVQCPSALFKRAKISAHIWKTVLNLQGL